MNLLGCWFTNTDCCSASSIRSLDLNDLYDMCFITSRTFNPSPTSSYVEHFRGFALPPTRLRFKISQAAFEWSTRLSDNFEDTADLGSCSCRIGIQNIPKHYFEADLWPVWGVEDYANTLLLITYLFKTNYVKFRSDNPTRIWTKEPLQSINTVFLDVWTNTRNKMDIVFGDTQTQLWGLLPPPCFRGGLPPPDQPSSISLNMNPIGQDTRTMIIVHACSLSIVHSCALVIVDACTSIVVHVRWW